MSATVQAEIVHHTVCEPKPNSRGFTRECWENTETGKFYSNAACTQELVGVALAKAVIYAKLSENPVTETYKFDDAIEDDHLDYEIDGVQLDLDLNWTVSTAYNHTQVFQSDSDPRYAHFTVKGGNADNVRMVWVKKDGFSAYGAYAVKISVNDTEVYSRNQGNDEYCAGVFVVSLPNLKEGDVVRFEVKQTNRSEWKGGPTFKASLEYNVLCSHNYPAGSAICSLCGYMKAHKHTYNETEPCSLCGAPNPSNEISSDVWTIADGGDNLVVADDITIKKLYYTRNFPRAKQWQALYVPFEMQPSDWEDKFDVAAISNFHEYINKDGKTEKVELEVRYVKNSKLLPNIPYLIRAKKAGEQTIVLNNATLKKTEVQSISCSSTERRYIFTGTYDAIDGLKSKGYIYVSGGNLCKADNDTDVLEAMRWYITIEDRESMTYTPASALAKSINIRLIGEDEATGIEDIRVVSTPVDSKASSIYSITGVKLANPHKGINIINGKKVLVK